jgi:glutamine amidotransferase
MVNSQAVIVDLGTGNLRSVSKALSFIGGDHSVVISSDPETIASAGHLVLPGQGAIGTWFNQLTRDGELEKAVRQRLNDGPVLGICLGLQSLYSFSEENQGTPGLGLLEGAVKHFKSSPCHARSDNGSVQLKIPHMGWNTVSHARDHPLWHNIDNNERFYFVHSYYVESTAMNQVFGLCEYGNRFTAAAGKENLFAVQFHPEKSQQAGLKLLENFLNWNGAV